MIRLFGHYVYKAFLLLGLIEFVIAFYAVLASFQMVYGAAGWDFYYPLLITWDMALLNAILLSLSMIALGLYQRGVPLNTSVLLRLLLSFCFVGLAMSLLVYSFPDFFVDRDVLLISMILSAGGIVMLRGLFLRLADSQRWQRRVLVLGAGKNAAMIEQDSQHLNDVNVVGYIRASKNERIIPAHRILAKDASLLELAAQYAVDKLVIAADDRRQSMPVDEILDCKMNGIGVLDLLSYMESEASRIKLDGLHPSWIFLSEGFRLGGLHTRIKRLFDLLIGCLLLFFSLPLMALVALAIFIESRGRGSVFFHQTRVGYNGRLFRIHKFRSMTLNAEADGVARWATKDDKRITKVGAFIRKARLDELPQIFNILCGEMSLVGPRPERPEFVEQLIQEIPFYTERHRVKPGLTGWAQLSYPYGSSSEDAKNKLEFDLYYVKNSSFFLDLIIMLETVEVVLWGKGAR